MSSVTTRISVKGKKRSRAAFANHKRPGPEIKKTNAFFDPAATGNNLYSAMLWVPFSTNIPSGRSDMTAAYNVRFFRYPSQGSQSYSAVGDSIRIRNILIKGYCNVHSNLMTSCNVKFYFLRWMNNPSLDADKLWNNFESISSSQSVADQITHMKHNYYKAVLNSEMLSKDISVQKLFELHLTPYHDSYRGQTMSGTLGDGVWAGHSVPQLASTTSYAIPIYKNLKVNENFSLKYFTESGSNKHYDHYGLVMFCDLPTAAATTFTPGQTTPNYTASSGLQPFELNFFTLVYYTDA